MKNDLFKNTLIIGIGTICTKCLTFLMIPLYTIWLSPKEYGNFDLIVSYLSLFIPIITLQIEQAIFRFSLKKPKESPKYLLNGLIVTILNIIIVDVISFFILKNSIFRISFILYFDSYAIFCLLIEYLRGNNLLKKYSLYNVFTSILIVALSTLFVPIMNLKATGLMYAYAISYIVVDLILLFKEKIIRKFKKELVSISEIKVMIKYSMPLIPNGISWWITNVSDRTLIKIFLGDFYNGIYAISCKIPTIISLVYSIFNLSWQQTAILTYEEEDSSIYYIKIFNDLISFLFCNGFLIVTILPFIFKYLISEEYSTAISYIPILVLGSIYLCMGQFLGGIFLAKNDTKKIGYTTMVAAIINIIVNLLFMKKSGLIIASVSTLLSYLYFFFSRYFLIKSINNFKSIFRILLYTILFMLLSFVVTSSIQLYTIFILLLVVIVVYVYLNRNVLNITLRKLGLIKNKKI